MGKNKKHRPFVSICTPTFNRRPFIENMFQCFRNQDYPKDRIEWIIVDDGTDKINDLIVTHSDADHSSQICSLIKEVEVGTIWMHRPWSYVNEKFMKEGINSPAKQNKLTQKLMLQYKHIKAIHEIAEKRGIEIKEPFAGDQIDSFLVISPSKEFLQQLLTESDKIDEVFKSIGEDVQETWDTELLAETCESSSENEASIVLYTECDGKGILLTGDAGVRALTGAINHLQEKASVDLRKIKFLQIPHHGSRNNVNPSILNNLLGNAVPKDSYRPQKQAIISATDVSDDHPSGIVVNAAIRRNWRVYITGQNAIRFGINISTLPGWNVAQSTDFNPIVKGYRE